MTCWPAHVAPGIVSSASLSCQLLVLKRWSLRRDEPAELAVRLRRRRSSRCPSTTCRTPARRCSSAAGCCCRRRSTAREQVGRRRQAPVGPGDLVDEVDCVVPVVVVDPARVHDRMCRIRRAAWRPRRRRRRRERRGNRQRRERQRGEPARPEHLPQTLFMLEPPCSALMAICPSGLAAWRLGVDVESALARPRRTSRRRESRAAAGRAVHRDRLPVHAPLLRVAALCDDELHVGPHGPA